MSGPDPAGALDGDGDQTETVLRQGREATTEDRDRTVRVRSGRPARPASAGVAASGPPEGLRARARAAYVPGGRQPSPTAVGGPEPTFAHHATEPVQRSQAPADGLAIARALRAAARRRAMILGAAMLLTIAIAVTILVVLLTGVPA